MPTARPTTGPLAANPCFLLSLGTLLLAALLCPGAALAHQGNPDYRSVIDSVVPEVPGIELEVIDYDADIRLTAPEGSRVEIPGYDGEPYARILPDGTVEVNELSPSAYLNTDRYGDVAVPEEADTEAAPRWETTRTDGTFQWHDHRSHLMSPEPPEHLRDETDRTEVFEYEIPLTVDGEPVTIEGTLYWAGSEQGSALPFVIGGLLLLVAGAAAAVMLRRRRAGAAEGEREAW